MVHETKESPFKKSPTDSSLAQLAEGEMIRKLWVQTPLGTIFDEIYFVVCNFRSVRLSDRNVSDFLFLKNPIVT